MTSGPYCHVVAQPIEAPEPRPVTDLDVDLYRQMERRVSQEMAAEFAAAGVAIDAAQVSWVISSGPERIRALVSRRGGKR